MSGAAFPQVNLDRIGLPFFHSKRTTTKSSAKRPMTPFFRQTLANLGGFLRDQRCVAGVSREYAAEITLPRWPRQGAGRAWITIPPRPEE